jgi:hypothetical protein
MFNRTITFTFYFNIRFKVAYPIRLSFPTIKGEYGYVHLSRKETYSAGLNMLFNMTYRDADCGIKGLGLLND